MHFGFPRLDVRHWVVPVASLPLGPGILNHNWDMARGDYVEKWHGNLEDVVKRPIFVNFPQHELVEEDSLDFVELFN
jgi:hypothetical protein